MSLGALLVLLVCALLVVPLLMAFWFAPALIVLRGDEPVAAMTTSFRACLRNMSPFLVYGVLGLVFAVIACIPLFLGLLVLFPWASRRSTRATRTSSDFRPRQRRRDHSPLAPRPSLRQRDRCAVPSAACVLGLRPCLILRMPSRRPRCGDSHLLRSPRAPRIRSLSAARAATCDRSRRGLRTALSGRCAERSAACGDSRSLAPPCLRHGAPASRSRRGLRTALSGRCAERSAACGDSRSLAPPCLRHGAPASRSRR